MMTENPMQLWTTMMRSWTDALPAGLGSGLVPGAAGRGTASTPDPQGNDFAPAGPFAEYLIDSWQRTILTWDVLRKRGNQSLEHQRSGQPPVLKFDYEVVIDGRAMPRPVNYQLLRILPGKEVKFDPQARPFMIFDPRAGHGPGIGGFKEASQVGVAMHGGHPVYLVSFFPEPMPGQTIEDIARAEVKFVQKVIELHPEAQSPPAIVGNCQGGWALMLMASIAPTLPGVISIAGSPLSYWAGLRGTNPMRFLGGLGGGSWMASLLGDLGNGKFDGSYLVSNFEAANPANTYWSKMHNLYASVEREEPRFLEFERWWGGHFYMTVEEMRFIVDELFVGNKLSRGRIVLSDGHRVDLRDIRSPIVVIASWGDNITPPQQALNWILDLYDSVEEMRARQQTIVYTIHDSIGHLGIFVSAKVALKEHAEFVGALDMIETLPPGLYEMVIEDEVVAEEGGVEHSQYVVRLEARELDDLKKFDDGRDDEQPFETVARVSEMNEAVYDAFLRPWIKACTNELTADTLRQLQPPRLERMFWSDMNPMMAWVKLMAEGVRSQRQPMGKDNPFLAAEMALSEQIETTLNQYRDQRDAFSEKLFFSLYESPAMEAVTGLSAPYADARKPRPADQTYREWIDLKLKSLHSESEEGDFAEAVYRIGFACLEQGKVQDARAYRMTRKIAKDHPKLKDLTRHQVKEKARRAAFIVQFDPEGALRTLPRLLPTDAERRDALDVIKRIVSWRPDIAPEHAAVIRKVEAFFGYDDSPVRIVEDTPAAS